MKPSIKDKVGYPFSKLRVYFSLIAGVVTMVLSTPILFAISGYSLVLFFLLLTGLLVLVSLKLKLYLLRRMQVMGDDSYSFDVGRRALFDRNFVALMLVAASLLLLPVILAFFDVAAIAFFGMMSFVSGFCLSEPLFYLRCRKEACRPRGE